MDISVLFLDGGNIYQYFLALVPKMNDIVSKVPPFIGCIQSPNLYHIKVVFMYI